jgi:protocatechuate 3,4-dioxygenase beta subunit
MGDVDAVGGSFAMTHIIRPKGAPISRRTFAAGALATAGLGWGAGAIAQQAQPVLGSTAESPMGPFYPLNPLAENDADLTRLAGHAERAAGTVIELTGRVLDLRGNPIPGAILEVWQANAAGRYMHESDVSTAPLDPHFQGFAAIRADAQGHWRIVTIKPGGYDSPIGHRPPHIHFDMRGRSHRNVAQLYFPEDAAANAVDLLYRGLGDLAGTSVATRDPADANRYSWDIILMG